jgi:SAM-dependent methyltransferase
MDAGVMIAHGACRGCAGALAPPFVDLGATPLANAFVRPERAHLPDRTFPLAVARCSACHLVQITDTVEPGALFSEYIYFSSYSDIFVAHARALAGALSERFGLGPDRRVVEIASNDGYLLQYFQARGIPVLGVEPARNIAAAAVARGIPTLNRFFGSSAVAEVRAWVKAADVIIGNNVLAHVPDVNDFLAAVAACLAEQGAAVFEFPYVADLLERTAFDTIYHEHVFYYSLSALVALATRARLEVFDVERQAIHGGSLRVFLGHRGGRVPGPAVAALLSAEQTAGLTGSEPYERFGHDVERLRHDISALLRSLKAAGHRLAAYGAPAKGNTLLNACAIGCDLIEFTVDRSPHKQGLLTPGARLPVREPEALLSEMPDYTVILPWNIADEIVDQQRAYLKKGGAFIVPVPAPRILGDDDLR